MPTWRRATTRVGGEVVFITRVAQVIAIMNTIKTYKTHKPICMISMMIICPNRVKVVPVSTTAKPVTVVSETAVKKASIMEMVS